MAKLLGGSLVYGTLSASGIISDTAGNSSQWNKAYTNSTTFQNTSSSFVTNTGLNTLSGNWQTAYTSTTALNLSSAYWNSVYTTVQSNSGTWGGGGGTGDPSVNTWVRSNSANAVFTTSVSTPSISATNNLYASNIVGSGNQVIFFDGLSANNFGNGSNTLSLNFKNGTFVSNNLNVDGTISGSGSCITNLPYKVNTGTCAIVACKGSNSAAGTWSVVNGGASNSAGNTYAAVGGGTGNSASGYISTVGGGSGNGASNSYAVVAGGYANSASGTYANILGGRSNVASGNCSAILGGISNNTNSQTNTFILGSNITAPLPNYTYVNNLSTQGAISVNGRDISTLVSSPYIPGTSLGSIKPLSGITTASGAYSVVSGGSKIIVPSITTVSSVFSGIDTFWRLDEVYGTRYNSVSTGNNLTDHGGVQIGGGVDQYAAFFNGDGTTYLQAERTTDLSGDYTIACWVRFDSFSGAQIFIGSTDSYKLGIYRQDDGTYHLTALGLGDLHSVYDPITKLGVWTHVAVTRESNNIKFYINGIQCGSVGNNNYDLTGTVVIGRAINYNNPFNGSINNVGIWKRSLNALEIAELYDNGSSTTYPHIVPPQYNTLNDGLTANWNFNESSGTRYDSISGFEITETNGTVGSLSGISLSAAYITNGNTDAWLTLPAGICNIENRSKTFSLWFNLDQTNVGYQWIFCAGTPGDQQGILPFYIEGDSTLHSLFTTNGYYWTNNINSGIVPTANEWHHAVLTLNGTRAKLYYDGALVGFTNYSGSIQSTDTLFTLGHYNPAPGIGVGTAARLDELSIWERELTGAEVFALYSNKTGKTYPYTPELNTEVYELSSTVYTVLDPAPNIASGSNSFVGGGSNNSATGEYSIVLGGGGYYSVDTTTINTPTTSTAISGIAAYWRLDDDGTGNVNLTDITGNGYNLTNVGSVSSGAGLSTTGAYFDGTGTQYLQVSPIALSGDFTVSTWLNLSSENPSTWNVFLRTSSTGTGGLSLAFTQDTGHTTLTFYSPEVNGPYTATVPTINLNRWYHIAFVAESGAYTWYVNGERYYSGASFVYDWTGDTLILGNNGSEGLEFNGVMNETGIWTRALSATEVIDLYNTGYGFTYPFDTTVVTYTDTIQQTPNIAQGRYSNILGGASNYARGNYTTITGGLSNIDISNSLTYSAYYGEKFIGISTIAGGFRNTITGSSVYAGNVIGGGLCNTSSADYGAATIAGGACNTASGYYGSTVGGGCRNRATGVAAVVSGGSFNCATGFCSTVGGGEGNVASQNGATVGGGCNNTASDCFTTVAGGVFNNAYGPDAFIGGGNSNAAGCYRSVVAGGYNNCAICNSYNAVVGGWGNMACGFAAFVGGGAGNCATDVLATVGGGWVNTASNIYAFVGGGCNNSATGPYTVIGGGCHNLASNSYSTVGGGSNNSATQDYSSVGGGQLNTASAYSSHIGGGQNNCAQGLYSVVAGGYTGCALNNWATVGGGSHNTAIEHHSTVSGGYFNTTSGAYAVVAGGNCNNANMLSFVGGGFGNTASGNYSAILGGRNNSTNSLSATFLLGTYLTAIAPDYTYVNNLSSSGIISAAVFYGDGSHLTGVSTSGGSSTPTPFVTGSAIGSIQPLSGVNIASGIYSSILGGTNNNTNSLSATFILGTSLTAISADYTFVNNLSAQGTINVPEIAGSGDEMILTDGSNTNGAGVGTLAVNFANGVFFNGGDIDAGGSPVNNSPTTVKAWVNYNATTQTIRSSYNVSSVTYNSTGDYTINFTTPMNDNNYIVVANGTDDNTASPYLYEHGTFGEFRTVNSVSVYSAGVGIGLIDFSGVYYAILGN